MTYFKEAPGGFPGTVAAVAEDWIELLTLTLDIKLQQAMSRIISYKFIVEPSLEYSVPIHIPCIVDV